MLFKILRRRLARISYYGRTRTTRQRHRIRILFAASITVFVIVVLLLRLRPIVARMGISAVSDLVTSAVNTVVNEKISDGSIDYSDMVRLEKDTQGHVCALTTNMPKVNMLETQIVERVIEILSEKRISSISIPVGNIIGGNLFSGRGFGIPVKVMAVGSTRAEFLNRFSAAGINQTRHQIVLGVTVEVSILLPMDVLKTTVPCEVNVAETVIVGDVPESYTFFEDNGEYDTALEKYDIAS